MGVMMASETTRAKDNREEIEDEVKLGRRDVIRALACSSCFAALALPCTPSSAQTASRPQAGDQLVFFDDDKAGTVIKPADLEIGQPPLLAYTKDPVTNAIRDSRASVLLLMKLKEADMDDATKDKAAGGIVAYSAVCTHEGCSITAMNDTHRMAVCNCHGSTFDLGNKGKVVEGPAVRRLAMLPLLLKDGELLVAGKLDGPIGPPEA